MKPATLAASLLILAGAYLAARRLGQGGEPEVEQDTATYAPLLQLIDQTMAAIAPTDPSQAQRNLQAFLQAIRWAEGTAGPNGYRTLFGGRLFDGWVDHPRIAVQFTDGQGRRLWTSAAGAYQFMAVSPLPNGSGRTTKVDTWDRLKRKLNLPDFSPASQDAAAVELIREAGALRDVQTGHFAAAVSKVRGIWASLPGAGYAQPEKSLHSLQAIYTKHGGTLA